MRVRYLCTALVASMLVADGRAGDGPAREARSENGQFVLQINPGRRDRGWPCEALLRERSGGAPARRIWEATLVNDTAPMQAYVRDDGKIVVTLDEFQRGGARNSVVVYGARGELLRHFLITDLLKAGDFKHVRVERRRVSWLDDARCGFTADGGQFVIELKWGRRIRIDLGTLQLVGTGDGAESAAVPPEMLAALLGQAAANGEGEGGETGAEADTSAVESADRGGPDGATGSEGADAADDLPALAADDADAAADAVRAALTEAPQRVAATAGDAEASPAASAAAERGPDLEPTLIAARATAGIDVPLPAPEAPVDYVEWLNNLGAVEGPDAGPVYAQAMGSFIPWSGDADVSWEAARGDAEALASPELAEWLAQNSAALDAFADASRYPTRGWSFSSPDGSLLSVQLPHLASLRGIARASVIAGRHAAEAGDVYTAADRYLDTLAAGAHIGTGATVIENLVGVAVQDLAADALLDLQAEHPELDAATLSEAAEAAYRAVRPPSETVQFERAFFLDTAQRMWRADPTGRYELDAQRALELLDMVRTDTDPTEAADWVAALNQAGFEGTVAAGQACYDALTEAFDAPYPARNALLGEFERSVESGTNPVVRALVPALGRYAFVSTRAESVRRGALLVTRLNAYAQANGSYPESLEAVGATDLAVDPFSAAPYVYRRTDDGFELYSVGGNGVDDGGTHDPKGEEGDLRLWPRPAE